MKRFLGSIVFASALGIAPAVAGESALELASLQTPIGAESLLTARDDADRTLIKENECDSPEVIALIERYREDVERTVVMDR